MKSLITLVLLIGILFHCVQSIPSSFSVTSLGKEIFNSTVVDGPWNVNKSVLYADQSKNCRFWKQTDGSAFKVTLRPTQQVKQAWIEAVADVSQINGLSTGDNQEVMTLLGVRDSSWGNIGALVFVSSPSSPFGMSGMIMTNWSFHKATMFNVSSGFHRYTLGYDYETHNITVYIDDAYVTSTNVHIFPGTAAYQYECGYCAGNNVVSRGTGKLYIKECNGFIPTIKKLYVNAGKGNDANDGLTEKTPLKTIGAAASKAVSGTTVYISDGVYRESVTAPSGDENGMITFIGTGKNVLLSGAVSASAFTWKKGSDNIWSADVKSEIVKAPIFGTYKNSNGEYVRVHQARTPNYRVETSWKVTEFWNTAMGGKSIMDCFGNDTCDDSDNVDTYMLADEAFKKMDDLVGARIFMSDRISGHYYYNNTIVKHDKSKGTITTDKERLFDGLYPGLGMYSQYYVYGKKSMIDVEGEYAFEDGTLYIKWSEDKLPDSLEFSTRDIGFLLAGKKYVRLENLNFMHYEKSAIYENGGWSNYDTDSSCYIYIENCNFDYIMRAVDVIHGSTNAKSTAHDWHINNCTFTHSDGSVLSFYGDGDKHFPNVAVVNFWVTNNYFYHIGFNSEDNIGISVNYVKYFYYLNNTLKYVSHNGLKMSFSASKNGEISTGYSLFRGNLFDQICSGNSDCGCLKFWSRSDSHVWKNIFVTENLCQNTFGWTKTSYNRNMWNERGFGGFGFYTDYVSGPVFYRNIVYNVGVHGFNIYKEWEDGVQTTVVNNLIVGSNQAVWVGGALKEQTSFITVKNNIYVDAASLGLAVLRDNYPTPFNKFDVNNNLYYHYGWAGTIYNSGVAVFQDSVSYRRMAHTFDDLHELAPDWETTNYSFDPKYKEFPSIYNLSYDQRHNIAFFDDGVFDVTTPLIDKGSETIPQIVTDMLNFFNIKDTKKGNYYDLGPFESGFKYWIPSSKKDMNRNNSTSEEPSVVSSAQSLYFSIPLFLVCFFFIVLF